MQYCQVQSRVRTSGIWEQRDGDQVRSSTTSIFANNNHSTNAANLAITAYQVSDRLDQPARYQNPGPQSDQIFGQTQNSNFVYSFTYDITTKSNSLTPYNFTLNSVETLENARVNGT